MKVFTPEISWHQKEPIFSVDFCNGTWKLASAGADFTVKIWQVKEDSEGNAGLDFLANLDRHSKPVNCVRFSPDGKYLASAGDDCIIIIWKLSEDEDEYISEPGFGSEEIVNKEKWTVHKMLRRGHLEDIYDLAWSPDGKQLISGSVDNSAIIWNISNGHFTNIIKDHKHYVQGVCWDPRGQYVITHSSDRTCRVYSLSKNRCVQTIHRASFPLATPTEDGQSSKTTKLFMDETMQSFFRRCQFSPDGSLLVLPGGIYDAGEKPVKATYVFARGGFNKPALCLPGSKKASVGVCFCPVIYENMELDDDKENGGIFKLPYRMCYAVATLDSVVFYDTQHPYPFGFVSNVHYASLTDIAWSSDGRILVVSSLDGYCSIVSFKDGELGKQSQIDPMEFVSSQLKAKREAKKEAKKKVELESKSSLSTVSDKEKEQAAIAMQRAQTPGKDQPTLHQFITPIRKRKRPAAKQHTPISASALSKAAGNGSPDAPIDLTCNVDDVQMKSPQPQSEEASSPAVKDLTPNSINKKTPKRASLITLGFKPVPKPCLDSASCLDSAASANSNMGEEQSMSSCESHHGQPRRINFTTISVDTKGTDQTSLLTSKSSEDSTTALVKETALQNDTIASSCNSSQPKAARRVSLVSLSVKRGHSGAVKQKADPSVLGSTSCTSQSAKVASQNKNAALKTQADPTESQSLKPLLRTQVIVLSDNDENDTGDRNSADTSSVPATRTDDTNSSVGRQQIPNNNSAVSKERTVQGADVCKASDGEATTSSSSAKEVALQAKALPSSEATSGSSSSDKNVLLPEAALLGKAGELPNVVANFSGLQEVVSQPVDGKDPSTEKATTLGSLQTVSSPEGKAPRRVGFLTLKKV